MLLTVLAVVAAAGIYRLGARSAGRVDLPVLGTVGEFKLVDRSGRAVTAAELRGRPWVADFVFTRCAGICPVLSTAMSRLQRTTSVRLVSVSVDPAHDTPEVLRAYAERYGATGDRWLFLTGPREEIYRLVRDDFRLAISEAPPEQKVDPGELVTHSDRLVLVDGEGRIRGYYHGTDDAEVWRLLADVATLAPGPAAGLGTGDLPHLNATLNAAAAVLLAAGRVLIRRRRVAAHRACMLLAFVVSVAFLVSYLVYHARVGSVRFAGTGAVRAVYLAILGSHTVLAATVPFLAVATLALALRGDYVRHRRLALWTWPVWMYVSVSGVVVYAMLYHLWGHA